MNSYEQLDERFQRAFDRVIRSSGRETFDAVLGRLPLTPSDESVEEIAGELGWSDEFMTQARAPLPLPKASAPVPRSRDVAAMFRAQAAPLAAAPVVAAPVVAAPARGAAAPSVPAVRVPPPPAVAPKAAAAPPPVLRGAGLANAPPAAEAAPSAASALPEPARGESSPGPRVTSEPVSGSALAVPADAAVTASETVQENQVRTGSAVANPDPLICAICQDTIHGSSEGGEECQAFPCGHPFHRECVTRWRRAANITTGGLRCPCCRTPVEDQDDLWDMIDDGPLGSNGDEASIL